MVSSWTPPESIDPATGLFTFIHFLGQWVGLHPWLRAYCIGSVSAEILGHRAFADVISF